MRETRRETGVGLFLISNLIEAHKGTMWVESEPGKGTTVWFRFPIKQSRSADGNPT